MNCIKRRWQVTASALFILLATNVVRAQTTGACCLPNTTCSITTSASCSFSGGLYHGNGSICSAGVCDVGCCAVNGACGVTNVFTCTNANGIPRAAGTCTGVVCTGACCEANGTCAVQDSQTCTGNSGQFKGFGSQCANQICGGACCQSDGTCALSNDTTCVAPDTFQGLGTTCGGVDCSGACCLPDGSCEDVSEAGCAQLQGGVFLGLTAACATSVCTGACCHTDGPCVEGGPLECNQQGGAYQGRGTTCVNECPVEQPTAFTYQGQLKRDGVPFNGQIDGRFSLWISAAGQIATDQVGTAQTTNNINVVDGLFTVPLDFGHASFGEHARWLQIEVHSHGDPPGAFTKLSPRQALTPTPFSLQTRSIATDEELRIVRGSFDGNIVVGTGFHFTSPGTGVFDITFDPPFGNLPTVTATSYALPPPETTVAIREVGYDHVQFFVLTTSGSGTLINKGFHFIAIGPR
ncbi:MAG: hypothetical protein HY287_15900 [Planctomycetes bacterium]|nr:hypothetical protein [Planctomycetota bacterium]MBI3835810.1 hypothetical protein [Planctomycetota bacterium]